MLYYIILKTRRSCIIWNSLHLYETHISFQLFGEPSDPCKRTDKTEYKPLNSIYYDKFSNVRFQLTQALKCSTIKQ